MRPLLFKKLNKEAFSYGFIEEVIKQAVKSGYTIEQVYNHAKTVLVNKNKGIEDQDSCLPIRQQDYGTCSYFSFDAWTDYHLEKPEIHQKEKIKTRQALEKQDKVLAELKKESKGPQQNEWTTVSQSSSFARRFNRSKATQSKSTQLQTGLQLKQLALDYQTALRKKSKKKRITSVINQKKNY